MLSYTGVVSNESERPKPQYGEYASEDERAAALARSGGSSTHADPQAPPVDGTAHSKIPAPDHRNPFDRIVTVFLLSFGAVTIFGSAANFLNFGEKLPQMVAELGMGEFHATAHTAGMGIVMLVGQALLWVLAAVWSYRRMRRQKLSWWVPVLLGALSFIVLSILLGSVLSTDPSFIPTLSKL